MSTAVTASERDLLTPGVRFESRPATKRFAALDAYRGFIMVILAAEGFGRRFEDAGAQGGVAEKGLQRGGPPQDFWREHAARVARGHGKVGNAGAASALMVTPMF